MKTTHRSTCSRCIHAFTFLCAYAGALAANAQLPTVFGPVTSTAFTATTCRGGLMPVDLDLDGDQDFVTLGTPGLAFITSVMNQGGTFVQGPYLSVAANPLRIDVADIDQDGDPDFLSDSGAVLTVNRNLGTSVSRTDYPSVATMDGAQFADIDGDGYQDIVVGVDHVRFGSSSGTFGPMQSFGITSPVFDSGIPIPERRVLIKDLDQDGDTDIARVGRVFGQGGVIEVYLQNAGTFPLAFSDTVIEMTSAIGASGIVAGDFDRDGSPDFAVVDADALCAVRTYRRQGSTFARHQKFTLGSIGADSVSTSGLSVADIDADGDDDLVTVVNAVFFIGPFVGVNFTTIHVLHGASSGLSTGQSGVVGIAGTLFYPSLVDVTGGPGFDLVGATSPSAFGTAPGTMLVRTNLLIQGTAVPARVLELVDGNWSVMSGTSLPTDLRIRAIDGVTGQPAAGVSVGISPTPFAAQSAVAFSATTTLTDAAGIATFSPIPQPITALSGNVLTVAASSAAAPSIEINYFVNGLSDSLFSVPNTGISTFQINFVYDRTGIPIVFAAEAPPQTPISTSWGNIATSILAPGPNLFLWDGLGIFGPENPSLVTTGNPYSGTAEWTASTSFPVGILAGLTYVFQVYAYDPFRPQQLRVIISNAVTRTF